MQAKRQQRKLNFLITQTELYAHFMSRKLTGQGDEERDRILKLLDEKTPQRRRTVKEGVLVDIEADDYGEEIWFFFLEGWDNFYYKLGIKHQLVLIHSTFF